MDDAGAAADEAAAGGDGDGERDTDIELPRKRVGEEGAVLGRRRWVLLL